MAIKSYGSFVRAVTLAVDYNNGTSVILASTSLRPSFLYIIRPLYVDIQAYELQIRAFRKLDDLKITVCVGQYSWLAENNSYPYTIS